MNNPWKGLNFYVEGEILYGRDYEIQSLSQYIFNNTQTVLYGRSGIGKSSILNAGIFPRARQYGIIPVSIRLKHDNVNNYVLQIRTAISSGGVTIKEILPVVDEDNETLWEFMHRHTFYNSDGEECTPLLVFDQFEEIFTLQRNENIKRDFFRQLGNLLNEVKPAYIVEHENKDRQQQTMQGETKVVSSGTFKGLSLKLNVMRNDDGRNGVVRYVERPDYHIVFAMREDFLSSLELYAASIPVMKDNRFGLLPLNEEQAADIIRLPQPGLVDDDVTKLIIEQVSGRTDFTLDGIPEIEVDAAVLSLYLSRLYIKKAEGEHCITADLVKASSVHIIHDFYVESVKSDPAEGEILSANSILKLEDRLLTGEGRRNNVSRSDLIALGITDDELRILTDKRKLLRQFHHGNDIRIEYIHDILCPVVKERKEQRELLKQQELEHERQEREKQKIIAEAEAHACRIRQRNKRILFWVSSIAFILVACCLYYWYAKVYVPNKVHEKYYASFELVNGWPVGIDELSVAERSRTPLYYKLSHIGQNKHDTDVEVMSSNSMLPSTVRIDNWLEVCDNPGDNAGMAFNDLLCKVKKLHFTASENGDKVDRMELRDMADSLLMLMSYFHLNDHEAWLNYMNTNGQSMPVRDNGIDRVKMSWDSVGRIEYQRFYTSSGVAKPIYDKKNIFGFYRRYSDDNAGQREYYSLNRYGLPDKENPYNLRHVTSDGDTLITSYFKATTLEDGNPVEAVGEHGYSVVKAIGNREFLYMPGIKEPVATSTIDFDLYGNPTRQTITGFNDSLPPVIEWEYKDRTGLLLRKTYLTRDGKPFGKSADDVYKWEMEYDRNGNIISEQRFDKTEKVVYSHVRNEAKEGDVTIVTDVLSDLRADKYLTKIDTLSDGGKISTAFYGKNGRRINRKVPFWADDSVMCHNRVVEKNGTTKTYRYYVVDGNGSVSPLATNVNPESYRATSFILRKIVDDNGNVRNMEILDPDSNIVKRMMYYIQNGETIGRAVWGIDDTPVRCPEWEEEGFGYYKIYYSKDFDKEYVYLQPFDEWMNNSVFRIDNSYMKVSQVDMKNWIINSSDNNFKGDIKLIHSYLLPLFDEDKSVSNLEIPYLHILSKVSPLYKSGFKDGDRIIRIGAWQLGEPKKKLAKEWSRLQNASDGIHIKVLRPTQRALIEFDGNIKNEPNLKLDAEYHFIKLSNQEKSFYENRK